MTTWDLPLGEPPRVLRASGGVQHGNRGVERYRLDGFWCINLFHGPGQLSVAGVTVPLASGVATITPPGRDHSYDFPAPLLQSYVHFTAAPGARVVACPLSVDLGGDFAAAVADVSLIARLRVTEPERAAARLWDLLWRHVSRPVQAEPGDDRDGFLLACEGLMRRNLARPFAVADAAKALGLSASQLNRRLAQAGMRSFGQAFRQLRLEQAEHLITCSDLPLAEIARRVGMGSPQVFNKAIRRACGLAPRELRQRTRVQGE